MDKICEDLGQYLFGVCGVQNIVKKECFLCHEHWDEIPSPRELLLKFPEIKVHMAAETASVLRAKARRGPVPDVVSAFCENFRANFILHETFALYRVGDFLPVDGLWMIRLEHDSPDVMFRSRVAFGYAVPKFFCYFSEATSRFLLKHGLRIIEKLEPKYVIIAPPNRMHFIFREDLEDFGEQVKQIGSALALSCNSIIAEDIGGKLVLSDELHSLPKGCAVLPKVVPSLRDIIPLNVS